MPPDVETPCKAPAEELRDEREQGKRETGEEPLVPPSPLHPSSLHDERRRGATHFVTQCY